MRHAGETVQAPTFPHEVTMVDLDLNALREPLRGLTWRHFLPHSSKHPPIRHNSKVIKGVRYEARVGYILRYLHVAIVCKGTLVCTMRISNRPEPGLMDSSIQLPEGGVPLGYHSMRNHFLNKPIITGD